MEMESAVDDLDGKMQLLHGQIDRYTKDVEALQETDDDMLADTVEATAREQLPENIAAVSASLEDAYDEFAVAVGMWGKDCRDERSVAFDGGEEIDAGSYWADTRAYASAFVENVRTVLGELFDRNVQVEESPPDVEQPYDERTVRRLDRLTETFEGLMEDVSAYDAYIEDEFGVTVTGQVEEEYGAVSGLTYK